jgi:hypothetical protein
MVAKLDDQESERLHQIARSSIEKAIANANNNKPDYDYGDSNSDFHDDEDDDAVRKLI